MIRPAKDAIIKASRLDDKVPSGDFPGYIFAFLRIEISIKVAI